jgi:hypothetical protein
MTPETRRRLRFRREPPEIVLGLAGSRGQRDRATVVLHGLGDAAHPLEHGPQIVLRLRERGHEPDRLAVRHRRGIEALGPRVKVAEGVPSRPVFGRGAIQEPDVREGGVGLSRFVLRGAEVQEDLRRGGGIERHRALVVLDRPPELARPVIVFAEHDVDARRLG